MQRNRYEMLTDENLIEELRGGDSAITDFIMNKYKPMVRKKARAMFLLGGENEDLIQEGMIGLFKAIRDYETRQGTSFASFAELCVSRQMYSAIEASQRKKHLPLNSYVSLYEESVEEGKKVPLIDTIDSSYNETYEFSGRCFFPLIDTIEPQEENNPEALYFGKEFTEIFSERLKENLSTLENHVLELHLMGTDYRKIAELLGKSPKAVDNALQRIKSKAQKLLKNELR